MLRAGTLGWNKDATHSRSNKQWLLAGNCYLIFMATEILLKARQFGEVGNWKLTESHHDIINYLVEYCSMLYFRKIFIYSIAEKFFRSKISPLSEETFAVLIIVLMQALTTPLSYTWQTVACLSDSLSKGYYTYKSIQTAVLAAELPCQRRRPFHCVCAVWSPCTCAALMQTVNLRMCSSRLTRECSSLRCRILLLATRLIKADDGPPAPERVFTRL